MGDMARIWKELYKTLRAQENWLTEWMLLWALGIAHWEAICLVTQAINHCSSSSQCPIASDHTIGIVIMYMYPIKQLSRKEIHSAFFASLPSLVFGISHRTKSNNISIELNWTNSNSNFDVPVRLSLKTKLSMWYAGVNDSYKQLSLTA